MLYRLSKEVSNYKLVFIKATGVAGVIILRIVGFFVLLTIVSELLSCLFNLL